MFNFAKIKALAKDQGIKLQYLTDKIGIGQTYFADVMKRNGDIPDERLAVIADILHTTPAYLRDLSDDPSPQGEKEKSPSFDEDMKRAIELFALVPEDKKSLVLQMIQAAIDTH